MVNCTDRVAQQHECEQIGALRQTIVWKEEVSRRQQW